MLNILTIDAMVGYTSVYNYIAVHTQSQVQFLQEKRHVCNNYFFKNENMHPQIKLNNIF